MSLDVELKAAADAARRAGALLIDFLPRASDGIRLKGDDPRELVSDADAAADELIRHVLADAFPHDAIVTEESKSVAGTTGRCWHVDPLDGTTNYLTGIPFWAVSIGLEQNGEGIVATVYDPLRNELFSSVRGAAGTCNGVPLCVSPVDTLQHAVVALLLNAVDLARPEVLSLTAQLRAKRELGATALELAWVAAGRLDGCLFRRTASTWDWLAGERLVLDAGGVSLPFEPSVGNFRMACGQKLAPAVRALVSDPHWFVPTAETLW